jgi:hypothetical protein
MSMKPELVLLCLERARVLCQEVLTHHESLTVWRNPALTDIEKTTIGLKLQKCLQEQHKWINALEEEFEKQSEETP